MVYLSQVIPDYVTGALTIQGTVSGGSVSSTGGHQLGNGTVVGPALYGGTGVPAAGLGVNGDYYFRADGSSATTHIYFKSAGAWAGIA